MKDYHEPQGEILVVDDNPDALELLSQLFEGSGYRLRMAGNGQQALWKAVAQQPDLILLDVRMPGMSGLDVCRCLKHCPATASIPVIILSAADSPEDRIAGFEAGAADFIGKPFVDADVQARVKTHIDMSLIRRDILWRKKLGGHGTRHEWQPVSGRREILIVEDTPESLQLLAEILKGAGFIVREAPNGELALWSATKHPPDLILLDVRMPGMNGIDVCLCLKMNLATNHIPVIFISALSDQDTKVDGFAAGAVDYITKPFFEDEVLARVHANLRLVDAVYRSQPAAETPVTGTKGITQQTIEEAFSYSACAILFINADGQPCYVNPAFVRLTGYALADLGKLDLRQWLAVDVLSPPSAPLTGGCHQVERMIEVKGDAPLACRITYTAVSDDNGRSVRIVAMEDRSGGATEQMALNSPALHEFASFSTSHSNYPGLEASLHGAVERGEMHLLYQPIFDVATQRLSGAEALLRWQHPRLGVLVPSQFLLAAEETGEIIPLGAWVIDVACRQYQAWIGMPLPAGFRVAINVGTLQFWQDGLAESIERAVNEYGLMAEHLELDITVETLREDLTQATAILHRLKALGVSLAVDRYSFGSLPAELLVRMPVDILKIDPLPILSMNDDPASQEAVIAIVHQAHDAHLRVLANGVEQAWHMTLVQSCRCDQAQGYLLGAPLTASSFAAEHLHVRP